MSVKSFSKIKDDFISELQYLSKIGTAIFAYPFVGKSKLFSCLYCLISLLTILTAVQLVITICHEGLTDLWELVNVMPNLAVVLMSFLKYFSIYLYGDVYHKIFFHFQNYLEEDSVNQNQLNIVAKYTRMTKFITRFVFYYLVLLVIFVDSCPRIIMFYTNNILGIEPQYLYPFEGWYPFDKVSWYTVSYLWECLMTFIVICIYGFIATMNISFTMYICMELKVLGNKIENLIDSEDVMHIMQGIHITETQNSIRQKLKNIIAEHQVLAQIFEDFDNVVGIVFLLNHIFSSVFICLTLFTATVVNHLYKSLRYFFMFFSLVIEIFIQCILGQELADHSSALANDVYSADWPYADKHTKIMLLILMARAQKPFQYTANGFLVLNLDTFSAVCSMSYQIFNLLRTTYC